MIRYYGLTVQAGQPEEETGKRGSVLPISLATREPPGHLPGLCVSSRQAEALLFRPVSSVEGSLLQAAMDYEYIQNAGQLPEVINRLQGVTEIGVDTEAAGYHRYHDRISLIQISAGDRNFIIDPITVPDLSALGPVFLDPGVEKIFHDADFDLRILHRDLGLTVHSLFDTQVAAAFVGERQLGLGAVVEKLLGLVLPKAYQRADWAERPLTEGMLDYAATDTIHLAELRELLLVELRRLGREGWAREEFTRREATRWERTEPDPEAFLRMKGARDLTPRGLAILREMWAWRESVGEERDQATFRVLANQSMLEISLTAPADRAALRKIQGISTGLIDRRGDAMLAAVKRGLAVPEAELPRFRPSRRWERDPAVEERAERLRTLRNTRAEELNMDAGFLISRAMLDEIARRNPDSLTELAAIPDVRNWQVEAVGDTLMRGLKSS
ncbi:MAG: HRDC domain-containing protein [Gemmatimonadota bacterium]|nr:HRDC domain-containing protein [Gemmatimonadota bacterium]